MIWDKRPKTGGKGSGKGSKHGEKLSTDYYYYYNDNDDVKNRKLYDEN